MTSCGDGTCTVKNTRPCAVSSMPLFAMRRRFSSTSLSGARATSVAFASRCSPFATSVTTTTARRAARSGGRHRCGERRTAAGEGHRCGARPAQRRAGKAPAHGEKRHGGDRAGPRVFDRARAVAATGHHRRGAYQPDAGAGRAIARLRRDHRRSAHGVCVDRTLPRREGDRGMAGRGAAAAQCRSLHRLRRAHARSEDRRPGAQTRAGARLFLYRCARLQEDPCQARATAEGSGAERRRHRAHPCPHRFAHRRGVAGRNRCRHHGRDHAAAAHEIGQGGGGMKFGPVAPSDALGATAVHSIRQGDLVLKKGTLIGPAEVAALKAAGVKDIVVARLEPGDVSEDQAAADIASAVQGEGVRADRAFTGRCNLFAETSGVLVLDKDAVDRLNRIDEAVTLATLPAFKPVVEGEMIATVKIIPFAVAARARDAAVAEATKAKPAIRVAPYSVRKIGIVSTLLPGLAPKVVEKTLKITAVRIAPAGASIVAERRVPHETPALAPALSTSSMARASAGVSCGTRRS